ncbi:uncharacterized protein LOC119792653 [Cyprinodon tularosa]|uniref:uncharacterized protein LOC119792653 n=1 Tax=Cyprinodon tularosa TaxID=77115 RepID=UPI0018E24E71|nr:uncharacterized protein LOC119792653 [Cyprinodon tularosa]XP_038155311.1 uncharacterized protein LOC119792653 [Cyprinodon tularosa]XP_038155312.1 uncharacterized protein LOC119792653 [Cyprinodon tularosa]XP_038155313.1 uncharacterized protein LOC119792653 [Cyprinodon tularosa]
MKDEAGQEEDHFSRDHLYEDYRSCYLRLGAEVRPCRDPRLLKRAARFLLRSPDLRATFTVFPFSQAVAERWAEGTDSRKHLMGFIKATEMLETLCINMFLQPWKKEIRSLKTFTGAFVYCLLPVLSCSTIQAILASIGYLPNSDAEQSEFTLSAGPDADRALLLGFELLLARVECSHLLDLLVEHQLGPQEALRLEARPPSVPQPKPRRYSLSNMDHSVMDLQRTYPDLAFRGRPLLAEQPQKAAVADCVADGTTEHLKTKLMENKALTGCDGYKDRTSAGVSDPSETSFRNSDESRLDDDHLSGPQAISLHITLRKGPKVEPSLDLGKMPPLTEASDGKQKSARDDVTADPSESPSFSSIDEEQQLRELAERMGQGATEVKGKTTGPTETGTCVEEQNQENKR